MSHLRDVTVIGGSGFIGAGLVQLLAESGAAVRVLSRSGKSPWGASANVRTLRGDVGNPEDVSAAIEGASVVYHLAAGAGNSWQDFERTIVKGTGYVAENCLRHRVERLVYTSSIAALYLGERCGIDERTGPDPKAVKRSHYSRAKSLAEKLLQDLHRTAGLPVVVVRPGVVVGPKGMLNHSGLGIWPSDTCCLGWGRGNNPLPFVLVGDVAQALANCMRSEEHTS